MSESSRPLGSSPVVVVTGASAGVGRATAIAFARRGYRVALLARGQAGLAGARHDVEAAGSEALTAPTDVADAEAVYQAADRVMARWGRIDVWVNDAMETVVGPVDRITPAEFRRVTEVTYLGTVHGTLAALRHMRPRNRGTIVQIGSALSYRAIPLQSAYCGAKFAIRGFTDSLRTELIHDRSRIRLTMLQLPGVNTPQFDWSHMHFGRRHQPVGACYQPAAVAAEVVRAAEHPTRERWLGFPAVQAILGAMLAPGFADRYLARTAYEGQLSDRPVLPGEPDTLQGPAPTDHGANGRFDACAKRRLHAVEPPMLRGVAALCCVGIAAAGFALGRRFGPMQWRVWRSGCIRVHLPARTPVLRRAVRRSRRAARCAASRAGDATPGPTTRPTPATPPAQERRPVSPALADEIARAFVS
ncbi:SDR family oxidoreductase [Falsiroseomonas sp. HW251]|uniref:SDR family oxidoreductase n=1 Tax=Falsiroseomonas sp. HW251 TaxID=3390998 RepID=UPI003D30FEEE